MTLYLPIEIPKEYWLDVKLFNYENFNYDDIRCLYNSPSELIKDFENVDGFLEHVRKIVKTYKNSKKRKLKIDNQSLKDKFVDATKNIMINLNILQK